MNFLEEWNNPSAEYRPIPFWSWNDKLEPDFLKWQIEQMAQSGVGGYFMHARSGIETEYLTQDWFECIQTGIDHGVKHGLNPWLYDEAGWPSGFAAGEVPAMGEEYHAKGLVLHTVTSKDEIFKIPNLLGVYTLDDCNVLHRYAVNEMQDGREYLAVAFTSCPFYIDIVNPKVVKAFIDCTHERYYARFKDDFGKGIQGFFTDEPRLSEGAVPWSYLVKDEFIKRYGYDVTDYLPALFIDCVDFSKIRYDFWAMINDMFVVAFMKQIHDWCIAHNCKLTGHMMMEESLYSQMTGTGGSMPFYEHMDMPGVDWLRRTVGNPVMTKQVGSVAEQLGKKHVLTESFALTGWDVSLEELKWIAEWQFVNGVNLVCQHLQAYTLRGMRKRDYPPSLFFQQTWWNEYKSFNDYLARLGMVLTSGQKLIDTLVIHPMRSAWVSYDGTNNERISKLDQDLADLCNLLSGIHNDYHFGDEAVIKEHAKVEKDRIVIGKYCYSTVILPSMFTIDLHTVDLLKEFMKNGGVVIAAGTLPQSINGRNDSRLGQFLSMVKKPEKGQLEQELIGCTAYHIGILENGKEIQDIHCCQIQLDNRKAVFMVNLSKEKVYCAEIQVPGNYSAVSLSLDTVNTQQINTEIKNSVTSARLDFAPMQSHILILEPAQESVRIPDTGKEYEMVSLERTTWNIEAMDYNCLTLDTCEYRIDEGEWQGKIPIILLMQKLLERKSPCDISMRMTFTVETTRITELLLVAEQIADFDIFVNGQKLAYQDIGWWKDSSFKKTDICSYLVQGENEIIMNRKFYQRQKVYDVLYGENVYETELNKLTYDTELESIYLIGNFGVISKGGYTKRPRNAMVTDGPFVLVDQPQTLESGDFTKQGLAFFSGVMTLGAEIEVNLTPGKTVMLNLGEPRCAMCKVYVNEKLVKTVLWAPYLLDITPFVRRGSNHIAIQIFSSNRNLFGPHHHVDGELYHVGPDSFLGRWSWCDRPTEGVPSNPKDKDKSYWTDCYCFTEFGI